MIQILLRFSLATTEGLLNTSPPWSGMQSWHQPPPHPSHVNFLQQNATQHQKYVRQNTDAGRTSARASFLYVWGKCESRTAPKKAPRLNNVIHWYIKKQDSRWPNNQTECWYYSGLCFYYWNNKKLKSTHPEFKLGACLCFCFQSKINNIVYNYINTLILQW